MPPVTHTLTQKVDQFRARKSEGEGRGHRTIYWSTVERWRAGWPASGVAWAAGGGIDHLADSGWLLSRGPYRRGLEAGARWSTNHQARCG